MKKPLLYTLKGLLPFLFLLVLSMNSIAVEIKKNQEDQRQYRLITLKNHLQVVLISDASTDKSAAAMNVGVGSFSDSKNRYGLAHFLEHMLFLGTKKYPDAKEYGRYLSTHGGYSNAYTSNGNTNYHFNVNKNYLEGALDRFAQFFIDPLFTADFVQREMNAVHSEHQKNLQSDYRRIYQVQRSLAQPNHPYSNFSTGNLDTLKDQPHHALSIRNDLIAFYKKYYSANQMQLVVLGKEPLDLLEQWVRKKFTTIKDYQHKELKYPGNPYGKKDLGTLIQIKPVKNIRRLDLSFSLPDLSKYYKSNPTSYLGSLLGDEGKGSLLSLFKQKGWVNSLSAGGGNISKSFSTFSISMELTKEGVNSVDEIVGYVFQYLKLIKEKGVQKWIFNEIQQMGAINFRFKAKENPFSYVRQLSSNLQNYPAEDIIQAGWMLEKFDEKLIHSILDQLKPENLQIYLIHPDVKTDQKEHWYKTPFSVTTIAQDKIDVWEKAKISSKFALPKKNIFIPKAVFVKKNHKPTAVPVLIQDNNRIKIWFKQDNQFHKPKANLLFRFISPSAYKSPKNSVLTRLFTLLLKDSLNEFAYPASIAGLKYSIDHGTHGLSLSFYGYDEKLPLLIKKVLYEMKTLSVKESRLKIFQDQLKHSWMNASLGQAYRLANYEMHYFLNPTIWHREKYLMLIDSISKKDVEKYIVKLLSRFKVEGLIHGNFTENEAKHVSKQIIKELKPRAIQKKEIPHRKIVRLTKGKSYLEQMKIADVNSAIQLYFQAGKSNTKQTVMLQLLGKILEKPAYHQLRTLEQLGYIVWSYPMIDELVGGFSFIVQSSVQDPVFLQERVEVFLQGFWKKIGKMNSSEFELFKEALIALKQEKPKTLNEESGKYWSEISDQNYKFLRQEKEIKVLKKITHKEIVKLYQNLFLSSSKRQMTVHAFGRQHAVKSGKGHLIKNSGIYKRKMPFYQKNP
ncbi:MAG: insulysin [bacterium]|jgi:insulysin